VRITYQEERRPSTAIKTIFLVDPQPVIRFGMRALLQSQPDIGIAGEAGTYRELLARLDGDSVDLVVFDPALPDVQGIDALLAFRAGYPQLPVLVFSGQNHDWTVMETVRTGVQGYLTKNAPAEQICEAVRTVAQGYAYLEPRIASLVMGHVGRSRNERCQTHQPDFTERERAVLRLLAGGKRNKDISRMLSISEHTVKFHLAALFQKLQANNRTDVVRKAFELGLVNP
jgi:DNA-binding NarL/FixJ family response regulator